MCDVLFKPKKNESILKEKPLIIYTTLNEWMLVLKKTSDKYVHNIKRFLDLKFGCF
jgi:hypothetical protein